MTIIVDGKTLAFLDNLTLELYQQRYRTSSRTGSKITIADVTKLRKQMIDDMGDAYWARENAKAVMEFELNHLRQLDNMRTAPNSWSTAETSVEDQDATQVKAVA